jgi:hypothetical protein
MQYVLERLKVYNDDVTVKRALNLHEYAAAPVDDTGAVVARVGADTIILDGAKFIGVQLSSTLPDTDVVYPADVKIERPVPPNISSPGLPHRIERQPQMSIPKYDNAHARVDDIPSPKPTGKRIGIGAVPGIGKATIGTNSSVFTAYPLLVAPATVAPCEQFMIDIGLAPQKQTGTIGNPITVNLPSVTERFLLDVLVVADGFGMPEGSRHHLEVDRRNPIAQCISVPLVAPKTIADVMLTTISVIYFFGKVPCGTAARRVAVIPLGTQPSIDTHGTGELWTLGDKPVGAVSVQPDVPSIDLTVMISKPDGNPVSGEFVWSFESPHDVKLPALPVTRDLGTDALEFGMQIIDGIQNSEALNVVDLEIGGLGKNIAGRMPCEFWQILRDVSAVIPGRPATVLFLTAEAHVPWELALVDPPLDNGAPPYLGCQTNMARWPLSDSGTPPLPPTASIDVRRLAVVVGDYAARSGWRKLANAEAEGDTIASRYDAIKLIANASQLKQLLTAQLPVAGDARGAEAVHFACHGEAISEHPLEAAIILGEGQRMNPIWLTNSPLGKKFGPFLFLNACQVGKAGELLGSFSGFAGESLKGGFRGFLAPLWSVDDGLAHDIALEFYKRVFGNEGTPPEPIASVLRDLRRRFAPDTEKGSASRLAYVFYGHPNLTMRLVKEN